MYGGKMGIIKGACSLAAAVGIMFFSMNGTAGAASSCVTCHTDEDMLQETATVVEAKASAMQSGAG